MAVERGAQDYLTKSDLTGKLLARSLRYAVERNRLQRELARMSIVDELTGLYNRRGFFTLGQKEYERAKRRKLEFLIIFADLDGLKTINDTYGHDAGDQYLQDAARFFKSSFRSSDILARIGGDEFAIVAYETGRVTSDVIRRRIEGQLARFNERENLVHDVSISIGIADYDPGSTLTLDELLSKADSLMYEVKKNKRK
jgi:diguanylate cyclase (GGDEF)-like protein